MNLEELEKECKLRLVQVCGGDISYHEGEKLIKVAFQKFKDDFANSFKKTIIDSSFVTCENDGDY